MDLIQKEKELAASFNKLAASYDEETTTFHHALYDYLIQDILDLILPKPEKNLHLLDSGGGTGKWTIYLAKRGYQVTLTDLSEKSINRAKEKIQAAKLAVKEVIPCNSEAIPFPDNSFDGVLLLGSVLSYTPHPDILWQESHRIIKPQGFILFDFLNTYGWANETTDPLKKAEIGLAKEILIRMPDWDYPARLFNPRHVEKTIKDFGFKLKGKWGLVNLSVPLPLEYRYKKDYEQDILEKYKRCELEMSKNQDCFGTALCCLILAVK
jgi:ubiquinone/menaquinone biosynthesis C-methylase UbiE